MAGDRVKSGDVRAELPELTGKLRPPDAIKEPDTLVGRLVPVADRIRNLYQKLGVHDARVWLVHVTWTGGRRGLGDPVITSRREILPVPRVRDMSTVARSIRATGLTEDGDVVVDRISLKYSEDDLCGRTPDMGDPDVPRTSRRDGEFFWEVEEIRPQQPRPLIRRFSPPVNAPQRKRDGLQWIVTLTKQGEDRARTGAIDTVGN